MSRASRDIAPLGLRMPTEVRDRIEAAARDNGRSMNAEILSRLQASFEPQPAPSPADGPISRELSLALAELRLSRAALAVRLLKFTEHLDPKWAAKYRSEIDEWRAAAERAALAVQPAFATLANMQREFMPSLTRDEEAG